MRRRIRALGLTNWVAHAVLGIGLCAPCMTVTPRMGRVEGLARWLGLLDEPRRYSILTGILDLLRGGALAIGAVLLVFSVLFPVAKLIVLRVCLAELSRGGRPGPAHAFATRLSKFSMVDVFVIALLVVASRSFPGGTSVDLEWGTYAFAAAALASVAVALGVARLPETPLE